jgi:hypothetical protein
MQYTFSLEIGKPLSPDTAAFYNHKIARTHDKTKSFASHAYQNHPTVLI